MRVAEQSFDDLVRDLREAGAMWFRDELLLKLERLIEMARVRTQDPPKFLTVGEVVDLTRALPVLELRYEDGDHAAP